MINKQDYSKSVNNWNPGDIISFERIGSLIFDIHVLSQEIIIEFAGDSVRLPIVQGKVSLFQICNKTENGACHTVVAFCLMGQNCHIYSSAVSSSWDSSLEYFIHQGQITPRDGFENVLVDFSPLELRNIIGSEKSLKQLRQFFECNCCICQAWVNICIIACFRINTNNFFLFS